MKKYKPTTKEELQKLIKDDGVYLGDIDTSLITDMSGLFASSDRKDFSGINEWDTSNVTDMACMFWCCENFNEPLEFDTSKATNMIGMFWQCSNFNKPLKFDTSKVTDMSGMFWDCKSFNQAVNFNIQNVKSFNRMFYGCNNLEVKNLHSFSKETMINDFYEVNGIANHIIEENWIKKLNDKYQPKNKAELKALVYTDGTNLDKIDTSLITDMSGLFYDSKRTDFSGINKWNTSNVTDMSEMFYGCNSLNQPLSFDTSKVTNMKSMFYNCESFNQPLNFNTKKVINFEQMLYGCKSFDQKVDFDMSSAIYTDSMFDYEYPYEIPCVKHSSFRKFILAIKRLFAKDFISIIHLYPSQYLKIAMLCVNFCNFFISLNPSFGMYKKRGSYKPKTKEELEELVRDNEIYLGDIDTSLITDMSDLFLGSSRGDFNGIEKWDTSNVTDMSWMFADCIFFNKKLEWNTSKVTNMRFMFNNCINFNKPLEFDISSTTDINDMLDGCKKLEPKNLKNFSKDIMIQNFYNLNGFAKFIIKNKWIDIENGKFKPKNKAELKALVYTDDVKLNEIDTSLITDMSHLFNATFDSLRTDFSGINEWDTSNVTDMDDMFHGCESLEQLPKFYTDFMKK